MTSHKNYRTVLSLLAVILLLSGVPGRAGYMDLIGYTQLCDELGDETPDGSGIAVTQVESRSGNYWMPDTTLAEFAGKTIVDVTGGCVGVSGHATAVGQRYYGASSSIAPGITIVDVYESSHWLQGGFLKLNTTLQPPASTRRIANHSYVGRLGGNDLNSQALRRLDWVVAAREYLQFVGQSSPTSSQPLYNSSFNAITVGRTDGNHVRSTVSLVDTYSDACYEAVRSKPDLVAPLGSSSATTPVGAAAAALLLDAGGSAPNAGRAEVIKAVLMAGADRRTPCACDYEFIGDYRADSVNRTANGLDTRFGAGRLNIYNSYSIIAGGEQDSGSTVTAAGYDYQPAFGGLSGSGSSAEYYFTGAAGHSRLCADLAWNLQVDGGTPTAFDGDAEFFDLDLVLFDVTANQVAASSTSAWDNTESILAAVVAGHQYALRVQKGSGQPDFLWDYGLAWRLVPNESGDQDGDGLPDTWENTQGLNANDPADALLDSDDDGLTNLEEYCRGTVINEADTDEDGLNDGDEFDLWKDSCVDSDDDGLPNLTDPDSDADQINDGPEKEYWGANWNQDVDNDGLYNLMDPDSDNDGFPDGVEIAAGFDPADNGSHPLPVPLMHLSGLLAAMAGMLAVGWLTLYKTRDIIEKSR